MGDQGLVSKMVQQVKEIVNCSDSEIYMMLVECHMNPNDTVMCLLSQDTFQEVKSKRNKKRDTKDQAESSSRRIPYRGARNRANDSYTTARGGGNKFNSNETRIAQSVPANRRGNHWAGSSSAPSVRPPPNSDPKNAEVEKAAPTGSTGAASSSSLPAPAYQSAWVNANRGKKTMAEIVKMGKPLHQKKAFVRRSSETQESRSKAPLKDEGSSTQKQDVSKPVSSILKPAAEPKPHAEQVSEPQQDEGSSVEKQDVYDLVSSLFRLSAGPKTHADQVSETQHVDESQMDDEVPEKKTNPVAFHPDLDQIAQCSHLRFGTFGLGIGSGEATSGFNDNLEDTQETGEDSWVRNLKNNFYGEEEEEEKQLRDTANDEETYYHIDLTSRNDHASSDYEREAAQREPPQEGTQMQNHESFFTNVMDLRGAGHQAAALNQHPALNAYYHQHGMPLGHHGNFTSYPFMPHGYMYSGFQQGFHVGNHQAPRVLSPSAPSFQPQNETSRIQPQVERPYLRAAPAGGVYNYSAPTSVHPPTSVRPPGFVQAQQMYQQQRSQQALMSLQQHRHRYQQQHHYHRQQSGGEASSQTREQLWPYNN